MKNIWFFRPPIPRRPGKKNPRGDAAGRRPANAQAKEKATFKTWLSVVAGTGLEPATSGL